MNFEAGGIFASYALSLIQPICRARAHDVFRVTLESDMELLEVMINSVSEDHNVDATLIWTKTDVEGNSRVGLFQVGWAQTTHDHDVQINWAMHCVI